LVSQSLETGFLDLEKRIQYKFWVSFWRLYLYIKISATARYRLHAKLVMYLICVVCAFFGLKGQDETPIVIIYNFFL